MLRNLQRDEASFNAPLRSEILSCGLFRAFAAGLKSESKYGFLDFGPADASIVDYFSQFHCRLTLWDISSQVSKIRIDDDDEENSEKTKIGSMLDFDSSPECDLVLCWDLLNYLQQDFLGEFARQLYEHINPGGVVHAFIASGQQLPMEPASYTLLSDGRMQRFFTNTTRPNPRVYFQQQLQRVLSPLVIEKAVLLRNGMQEYLFRRR